MAKLQNKFKEVREKLKISQEKMAQLLNIPYNTYIQWERNTMQPYEKKHKELARKLGLYEADLFEIQF